MDTLYIWSAYVAGWSDVRIVALVMAMHYPDKVKKLAATGANVFVDSTAFARETWGQMEQGYEENRIVFLASRRGKTT